MKSKYLLIVFLLFSPLLMASDQKANRGWEIFMQLGYNPQSQKIERDLAFENIEDLIRFAKQVLYHFQFESKTKKFVTKIRGKMASLDIGNLYEMLPHETSSSQWKSIGIGGKRLDKNFQVELIDPHLNQWLQNSFAQNYKEWHSLSKLGDFALRVFARPNKSDTYIFRNEVQSHLGNIHFQSILRGGKKALGMIQFLAFSDLKVPAGFRRQHSHLSPVDLKIVYGFARYFPNLHKQVHRYIDIRKIAEVRQNSKGKFLKMDIIIRPRLKNLKEDFSRIHKVISNLKGIFVLRSRIYDKKGRLLFMANVDSKTFTFRFQFLLNQGRILRCKMPWEPDNLQGIDVLSARREELQNIIDAKVNFQGIRILIRNFHLDVNYELKKGKINPKVQVRFHKPPKVFKIEGYLFGVIPLWLIDFIIPSNIDSIINGFLNTLAEGNSGRGLETTIEFFDPSSQKGSRIRVRANAEVLANGMIKFAFSFQSQAGLVQPKLYQEFRRFGRRFWHGFVADYFKFRYGD